MLSLDKVLELLSSLTLAKYAEEPLKFSSNFSHLLSEGEKKPTRQ